MDFKTSVHNVVRRIPAGKTLTYKEVATLAGSPRAYRAVGNLLAQNFDPSIPCHRVIRSDGNLGGYNRGAELKKLRLQEETLQTVLAGGKEIVLSEKNHPLS